MSVNNTVYTPEEVASMLKYAKRYFFIGIGGVNMSSLAELTAINGFYVAGSDRTETAVTEKLKAKGISVYNTHDASHIEGFDAVIFTVAISEDNPEYTAAKIKGLPLISRAEYLNYLMSGYSCPIGVCGMHGKSTTTSMCASAFHEAGADPTVLCGAVMPDFGSSYCIGKKNFFIFEACEYMDSFLSFWPNVIIMLNIEMDHVDYFEDITQIRRSYSQFASRTGASGTVIANWDDENVRLALSTYTGTVITFSTSEKKYEDDADPADFYIGNTDMSRGLPSFDVFFHGKKVIHMDLNVPGRHNIANALASFAAAATQGLDPAAAVAGICRFTGAERRMELRGKYLGADVYDDYAHHPTEIAATLQGCRDMGYDRVYCVFQPHTYSRTYKLFDGFASALRLCDGAILADIYAAREMETFGISSRKLAEAVGNGAEYYSDYKDIAESLASKAGERTAIVVMGAGDIYKLFPLLGL